MRAANFNPAEARPYGRIDRPLPSISVKKGSEKGISILQIFALDIYISISCSIALRRIKLISELKRGTRVLATTSSRVHAYMCASRSSAQNGPRFFSVPGPEMRTKRPFEQESKNTVFLFVFFFVFFLSFFLFLLLASELRSTRLIQTSTRVPCRVVPLRRRSRKISGGAARRPRWDLLGHGDAEIDKQLIKCGSILRAISEL